MKIITISREFGSGGRELGKRLADLLGYDYYDREIITAIAENRKLNADYVEKNLENHAWKTIPLTFRRSFTAPGMMQTMQTSLLLEQKRVIESIAKAGNNCVIVGRNADVYLREYHPLNLFVCADMDAKIRRCQERAASDEILSPKEMERNARRIDKSRAHTREIITDSKWGDRTTYHLTINTTEWSIKELTLAVADFSIRWFRREK